MSASRQPRRAFTLVELLVVIGIVAIMVAILLPALNKARQASRTVACLSNCRQMGTAWAMYLHDSKGRLPESVWNANPAGLPPAQHNEFIWNGFWFGILGLYKVQSSNLLCPEASDPMEYNLGSGGGIIGAGTAKNAWNGRWQTASPVGIRISSTRINPTSNAALGGYRIGSYGFNGNLFFGQRPASAPSTSGSSAARFGPKITSVKRTTEVPAFYDATWIDNISMHNGTPSAQPAPPPNLQGTMSPAGGSNNDWRVLLARHGRAINVCFADGHAATVKVEDVYNMLWTPYWRPYTRTNLPKRG